MQAKFVQHVAKEHCSDLSGIISYQAVDYVFPVSWVSECFKSLLFWGAVL